MIWRRLTGDRPYLSGCSARRARLDCLPPLNSTVRCKQSQEERCFHCTAHRSDLHWRQHEIDARSEYSEAKPAERSSDAVELFSVVLVTRRRMARTKRLVKSYTLTKRANAPSSEDHTEVRPQTIFYRSLHTQHACLRNPSSPTSEMRTFHMVGCSCAEDSQVLQAFKTRHIGFIIVNRVSDFCSA